MLSGKILQGWSRCFGLSASEPWKFELNNGGVLLALLAGVLLLFYVVRKLRRSWWTLRAAAFAPTLSRMVAGLVKTRAYSGEEFLRADGAAERWVEVRKRAIDRLASFFEKRSPKSIAWGNEIRESFADLRFTPDFHFPTGLPIW
jgi:hypothetical protein